MIPSLNSVKLNDLRHIQKIMRNKTKELRLAILKDTKLKIKNSIDRDLLIIQSINSVDEFNKSINLHMKRFKEWIGYILPELTNDISDDKLVDLIRNKQREFALSLFNGVIDNLKEIDDELKIHLESWDLERVGYIERAILRLGVYELMFTDLDKAIAINEAIELSKKLGTDQSPKFVNGVLDAIANERKDGVKSEKGDG